MVPFNQEEVESEAKKAYVAEVEKQECDQCQSKRKH